MYGEFVRAPHRIDPDRADSLFRPSEKGVEDGERVNESVSQNAGPEISIRHHVRRSQDQAGNSGIDYPSRTFVIMSVTKENRHEYIPSQ